MPIAHAVWLNTQNNAWLGSKISIICCELSRAPTPPNLTPGALPVHPAGKLPSSRPFVPHTSKFWLRHWCSGVHRSNGQSANSVQRNARRHVVQRERATQQRTEKPRDTSVQRDHATLQRAEKPRDTTWCRGTARRHLLRRNRAMPLGAEGPRDATACREAARAMPPRAEGPRDAMWCRESARRHAVQRDRATLRGAEVPPTSRRADGPRDATACR